MLRLFVVIMMLRKDLSVAAMAKTVDEEYGGAFADKLYRLAGDGVFCAGVYACAVIHRRVDYIAGDGYNTVFLKCNKVALCQFVQVAPDGGRADREQLRKFFNRAVALFVKSFEYSDFPCFFQSKQTFYQYNKKFYHLRRSLVKKAHRRRRRQCESTRTLCL